MIRIRTGFNDSRGQGRVFTLFHDGKWVTMGTGMQTVEATSLLEAGQNHLRMANELRNKLNGANVSG